MKSYLYAAITVILWSSMPAVVKSLVSEIPNFQTITISSLFAFIFLLIVNYYTKQLAQFKYIRANELLTMAWFGFLGLFLYSVFYYYGLSQLSSQEACVLNYLWPIMIVLFSAPILGEKLTRQKIVAILLSFGGIIVIAFGGGSNLSSASDSNIAAGIAGCIIAAACYGLFCVLNKKSRLNQQITMMIIWLTTTVCSLLVGVFVEEWVTLSAGQILGLIWLGVGINAIAYLTWALALEGADNTARIANLAYLTLVLAIFVSTLLFNEPLAPSVIPALFLIIAGILIQSLKLR